MEKWLPFIISFSALAFSLCTYIIHDKKIKKQSSLINEFQIEKNQKEKEENKKAIIEANISGNKNGYRELKVYNKGKAIARKVDVNIILENENDVFITENPSPIDIRPQQSVRIVFHVHEASPDKIRLEFTWNDDFKEENYDFQEIQI